MKKQFSLIIISFICFSGLFGQSKPGKALNVISSAGSSIESEDLVISWTVGENIIDFLQIQEAITPKPEDKPGVMRMDDGTLLKVYPTLTTGPLTIKMRRENDVELFAEFHDMNGSKVKIIRLDADQVDVDLSDLGQGMYLLKIINKSLTDQKVVKVVKH